MRNVGKFHNTFDEANLFDNLLIKQTLILITLISTLFELFCFVFFYYYSGTTMKININIFSYFVLNVFYINVI